VEVTIGSLDFGPQAVKTIALKPDGLYSHLNVGEHPRFCKALYERGMKQGWRVCAGMGANGGAMYELGRGFLEDTYIWDFYDFGSTNARWQAYVDAYEADHDGQFPFSAAIHGQYEAVYAIKAAFEDLGITGDPDKRAEERIAIRDYLWNAQDIDDPQGQKWSYKNGQKIRTLLMFQIKNNELELVSTVVPE
jgi:hypothetical protein